MATIIAKKNRYDSIWNPLDPDNWIGGVVPGPDDIAKFHHYSINSTYENNYQALYQSYQHNQDGYNISGMTAASAWSHTHNGKTGYFSSSFWGNEYHGEYPIHTWMTQSNNAYDPTRYSQVDGFVGQNFKYGSMIAYGSDGPYNQETSSIYTHWGLTNQQNYINNYSGISRKGYNTSVSNRWHSHNLNVIRADYANYGPRYYDFYTKMFRVDGVGSTVSLTIDGVTISESDTTTYNVTGQRLGYAIADATASMAKRMVDLFEASSLHINNGGKWKVWGPHNLRGWYTNNELQICNGFTIAMETGSGWSSGPSISDSNLSYTSYDGYTRAMWHYGMFTGSVYDLEFPAIVFAENRADGLIQEGTSSMRWSTRFGNGPAEDYSNQNLATYNLSNPHNGYAYSGYLSGSGCFEMIPAAYTYWQGIGPGNYGRVKVRFDDTRYNYNINSAYHDRTFSSFITESVVRHDQFIPLDTHTSQSNHTGDFAAGYSNNPRILKQGQMQRWQLTGSQEWNVGRIELGYYQWFHVKDQAKIILHDLQQTTNGTNQNLSPTIDFETIGVDATFLMTDETTLAISSSRTNYWSNYEHGIYQRRNGTSVIISGSANYSSSKVTANSSAGDNIIQVANASECFAPGDIVSIQSTGSVEFHLAGATDPIIDTTEGRVSASIDPTDPNGVNGDWYSGSYDELLYRQSSTCNNLYYNGQSQNAGGRWSPGTGFMNPMQRNFTHTIETDELVYVEATSSNTLTTRKFYGYEGEIQSDMGLYSRNDFISTFTTGGLPDNYDGTKRVVLVDSNHKRFKKGDKLVISGSIYTVLHNTTYLSQSVYYDFSRDDNPPLEQMIDLNFAAFSASSIWPIPSNADGTRASNVSEYLFESQMKSHMVITGSYIGSTEFVNKYGAIGIKSLGRSGSSNGYRALRMDPTLSSRWSNAYGTHHANSNAPSYRYMYHNNYTTWYSNATFQVLGTDNFEDGEIEVSGSILRDGFYDPTSSIGYWNDSGFGASYGHTPYTGPPKGRYDYDSVTRGELYEMGYPRSDGWAVNGMYHGMFKRMGSIRAENTYLSKHSNLSYQSNNPGLPYRYYRRKYGKSIEEDPNSGNWSISSWANDFTASYYKTSASFEAKAVAEPDKFAGSGTIRITVDDNYAKSYLSDGNGNELLLDEGYSRQGRGRVGLSLNKYAGIHSVNVKIKWQQLILDTQDSFNYKDQIYESNLLYDHYAGKDVYHIATVVKDAKGHKNLLWEYMRTKGDTNILPYVYGICDSGTTAGTTSTNYASTRFWQHVIRNYHVAIIPKENVGNYYISNYQANDNFYVIYDLNTQVTFDTIGMIFVKDALGFENVTNNQMNNVEFQVCDDVGVESPAWEIVRAKANDTRYSNQAGCIRFYTFPSGSVNKRYIKYHSRGGTNNALFANHSFFGIYNFSGSCADSNTLDASSVAGGFADAYGSPTASMCQIELASTKNWKVGDMIYFWSKQMGSPGTLGNENYQNTNSGYNTPYVTGVNGDETTATTLEAQILGGKWPVHTITNIQGNIVTLDRPVCHTFIDAGTLAYKYNRGNITLESRNTGLMFNIFDYNNYNRTQLKNVTGKNFYPGRYSNTYFNLKTIEDVGMLPYRSYPQYSYYYGAGLFRNLITTNWASFSGDAHWSSWQTTKNYNITNHYFQLSYGPVGYVYGSPGTVVSFCRSTQPYGYNPRIQGGSTSNRIGIRGDIYYQNNFMGDDQYSNGARVVINDSAGGTYTGVIHIGENAVTDELSSYGARYIDRGYGAYSMNKNPVSMNHEYSVIFRRTFWNPYVHNPKYQSVHTGDISSYHPLPFSNVSTYKAEGQQPIYERANQNRYFKNRNILYKNRNYSNASIHFADSDEPDIINLVYGGSTWFDMLYSSGVNQVSSTWECQFSVKETTDIRLDISMYYRVPFSKVYSYNREYADSQAYNQFGLTIPYIIVYRLSDHKIFYKKFLYDTAYTNLNIQEIMNLDRGIYKVQFINRSLYQTGLWSTVMKYKDLKMNIVTTDMSKIDVIYNDWDEDIGLKSQAAAEHKNNNKAYPGTENNGINAVLKQSNDLSGTKNIKFNKIKL